MRELPHTGKWRLIYNVSEDHYNHKEATGKSSTPKKNKIEYFDSKSECIDRIIELGITLNEYEN